MSDVDNFVSFLRYNHFRHETIKPFRVAIVRKAALDCIKDLSFVGVSFTDLMMCL